MKSLEMEKNKNTPKPNQNQSNNQYLKDILYKWANCVDSRNFYSIKSNIFTKEQQNEVVLTKPNTKLSHTHKKKK